MEYNFEITRGPVDVRKRKLVLTRDYIEYESKAIRKHDVQRLYKNQIHEVRIGMRILRGIEFPMGRQFIFDFKISALKSFKIRFSSSVKNRKNNSLKLFNEINHALWKLYLNDLMAHFKKQFDAGQTISLAHVSINKQGVTFKKKTSINRKSYFVPWAEVTLIDHHENFYVASKTEKRTKRLMNVCDDWNAVLLYAFLKSHLTPHQTEH